MSPQRKGRVRAINKAKIAVRKRYPFAACERFGQHWRIINTWSNDFLCTSQPTPRDAWRAAEDHVLAMEFDRVLTQ